MENVTAYAVDTSSIIVSWQRPREGVYHSFNVSVNNDVILNTNKTTITLDSLTAGSLYSIKIETVSFGVASSGRVVENVPTCKYISNIDRVLVYLNLKSGSYSVAQPEI